MVQVAKRYYHQDMTINVIAKELGLTRWQASRLLTDARDSGIVRIEIVPPTPRRPDLESRLQRRFGLKDAAIVPVDPEGSDDLMLDSVAQAAGRFLAGLDRFPLIGVSWGRTMSAVARRLPPFWNDGVEVVMLNGAMNVRASATRTNNVAELFARAANGHATLLPVPAILGKAATRVALEQDPTIASVLDLGRRSQLVCFGLGALTPDSVLVQSGFVSEGEARDLQARGAVGDILSRFIDADGKIIDHDLDDRTIGASLASCRDRTYSIGVGAGPAKHAVTLACLRAGYINVLVTDEQTALFLLEAS
nr:sugar-binding domain-containing protein [Geminicoccus roseus]